MILQSLSRTTRTTTITTATTTTKAANILWKRGRGYHSFSLLAGICARSTASQSIVVAVALAGVASATTTFPTTTTAFTILKTKGIRPPLVTATIMSSSSPSVVPPTTTRRTTRSTSSATATRTANVNAVISSSSSPSLPSPPKLSNMKKKESNNNNNNKIGSSTTQHCTDSNTSATTASTNTDTVHTMIVKKVIVHVQCELKKVSNIQKAKQMQKYVKNEFMPMYGVNKPDRAIVEKGIYDIVQQELHNISSSNGSSSSSNNTFATTSSSLSKVQKQQQQRLKKSSSSSSLVSPELYESLVMSLWELPHREEKYLAIDVAMKYKHCITLDALPMYERMLRTSNDNSNQQVMWWDFVDPIAVNLIGYVALQSPKEMKPILECYIHDTTGSTNSMWIRRTALLSQLKHKHYTNENMLYDFCQACHHEKEFFIRKAIGWILREYSKTNPKFVQQYLIRHKDQLSTLSYREGSKYLINKLGYKM